MCPRQGNRRYRSRYPCFASSRRYGKRSGNTDRALGAVHTASFRVLEAAGKYAEVDLEFSDGDFVPKSRGWTTGIARRAYPIAYDKWVREQVEEILGLPELYQQLPKLFEIQRFESQEIADKAEDLVGLFEKYTIE